MKRYLRILAVVGIGSGFLAWFLFLSMLFSSCAVVLDFIGQTHYKTFELTIDEQKIMVNLPNELPSMDKAVRTGEACFNAKVCRQGFCLSTDPGHDHVDFIYIRTDVVALVWTKENEMDPEKRFLAWIYIEGKPISAPINRIKELIRI